MSVYGGASVFNMARAERRGLTAHDQRFGWRAAETKCQTGR